MHATITRTRTSIATQLRLAGIEFTADVRGGVIAFIIDGETYTPGEAAATFLGGVK